MPDSAVIVRSQAEPAIFGTVFDRHFATIHRYVARRIGPDGADDVAGDVFRIAFERRQTFDPRWESARPWLYGIATNLLRGQVRNDDRRARAFHRAAAALRVPSTDDWFERVDEQIDAAVLSDRLWLAVSQLTQRDRDALILFAVEGLTYAEVGTALAIPVGTVRSRISRSRGRLRELLGASGQQLEDWREAEDQRDG